MTKSTSTEPVHVQLLEPKELRKNVLDCALDVGKLLVAYEEYGQTHKERLKTEAELMKLLQQIKKAETSLSKTQLPTIKSYTAKKQEEPKEVPTKKVAVKKEVSEVDKLQAELAEIEKKLQRL